MATFCNMKKISRGEREREMEITERMGFLEEKATADRGADGVSGDVSVPTNRGAQLCVCWKIIERKTKKNPLFVSPSFLVCISISEREKFFFFVSFGKKHVKMSGPPAGAKKSLKKTQRTTRAPEFLDPHHPKTCHLYNISWIWRIRESELCR